MRNTLIRMSLLSSVLAAATAVAPQEHLPRLQQCRANVSDWTVSDKVYLKRFPFHEIMRRLEEMHGRSEIDLVNKSKYFQSALYLSADESHRAENFINRHNLFEKVLAED